MGYKGRKVQGWEREKEREREGEREKEREGERERQRERERGSEREDEVRRKGRRGGGMWKVDGYTILQCINIDNEKLPSSFVYVRRAQDMT